MVALSSAGDDFSLITYDFYFYFLERLRISYIFDFYVTKKRNFNQANRYTKSRELSFLLQLLQLMPVWNKNFSIPVQNIYSKLWDFNKKCPSKLLSLWRVKITGVFASASKKNKKNCLQVYSDSAIITCTASHSY